MDFWNYPARGGHFRYIGRLDRAVACWLQYFLGIFAGNLPPGARSTRWPLLATLKVHVSGGSRAKASRGISTLIRRLRQSMHPFLDFVCGLRLLATGRSGSSVGGVVDWVSGLMVIWGHTSETDQERERMGDCLLRIARMSELKRGTTGRDQSVVVLNEQVRGLVLCTSSGFSRDRHILVIIPRLNLFLFYAYTTFYGALSLWQTEPLPSSRQKCSRPAIPWGFLHHVIT